MLTKQALKRKQARAAVEFARRRSIIDPKTFIEKSDDNENAFLVGLMIFLAMIQSLRSTPDAPVPYFA